MNTLRRRRRSTMPQQLPRASSYSSALLLASATIILIAVMAAITTTDALDDGLARTPPMGWRSWNLYGGNVTQDLLMKTMDGMASRKRTVDGVPTSLCDLGYCNVGLDDNWQDCRVYDKSDDGNSHTYHDGEGNPLVNHERFPDMRAMTDYAHGLNLTAGWYFNNCLCQEQCPLGDNKGKRWWEIQTADRRCYEGDVRALIKYGFDAVKLDDCGRQTDLEVWRELLDATGKRILTENCHFGKDAPVVHDDGSLHCPYHYYRVGGDVWAHYASVLSSVGVSMTYNARNLSRPGCWAYPDMLEVGCKDGPHGPELDVGLNAAETRTHFGAWSIVSSPLILSHDVNDDDVMDEIWDVIANPEAIEINQAWHGFAGGQYIASSERVRFHFVEQKWHPSTSQWQILYKPLDDDRVAILMINSSDRSRTLPVDFVDVPELRCARNATRGCAVRDVWKREDLGVFQKTHMVKGLASHDSAFLVLSTPKKQEANGAVGSATGGVGVVGTTNRMVPLTTNKVDEAVQRKPPSARISRVFPAQDSDTKHGDLVNAYDVKSSVSNRLPSFHYVLAGPLAAVVAVLLTSARFRQSATARRRRGPRRR